MKLNFLPKNFLYSARIFTSLLLLATAPIYSKAQTAQSEITIPLTGFTADVIADAILYLPPILLTTSSVDLAPGNVLYIQGYGNHGSAFSFGLPTNGKLTAKSGRNYQLARALGFNDLRLTAGQSGTLTFGVAARQPYLSLYILGFGTNNSPTVAYTIHFSDGSTSAGSITLNDWFCDNCTDYAVKDIGRANYSSGDYSANTFAFNEYQLPLTAAEQLKSVTSVTFTASATQTGVANIFAITGFIATPVPVVLVNFTAQADNQQVQLQWQTSQEIDSKQFSIERASAEQPSTFAVIGTVASKSSNGAAYQLTDIPPVAGTYIYRLKQQDINGNEKILASKSATISIGRNWIVQDMGSSWRLLSTENVKFRLIDMYGRIIQSNNGSGVILINKPAAHGIYELQVESRSTQSTQKLYK
jgi:hypothetical protein